MIYIYIYIFALFSTVYYNAIVFNNCRLEIQNTYYVYAGQYCLLLLPLQLLLLLLL